MLLLGHTVCAMHTPYMYTVINNEVCHTSILLQAMGLDRLWHGILRKTWP